jgi:hypothetical protein
MPMTSPLLRELPEPRKIDNRLLAVCAKKQNGKCSRNMPNNVGRYATVGEVDAKSKQNLPDLKNQFLH